MTEMREWWEKRLTEEQREAWLKSLKAGRVDPALTGSLPPDQQGLTASNWVSLIGTGKPDAYLAFHDDLRKFLQAEQERRWEAEE